MTPKIQSKYIVNSLFAPDSITQKGGGGGGGGVGSKTATEMKAHTAFNLLNLMWSLKAKKFKQFKTAMYEHAACIVTGQSA